MLRLEYQDGDQGSWIILNRRGEVLGSYLDRASALAQYQRATGATGWRQLATVQSRDPWKDGFRAGYSRALQDGGDQWLRERAASFEPLSSGATMPDPYRFRYWALSLVDGRPVRLDRRQPPRIDGRLTFYDEGYAGKAKQVLIVVEPAAGPSDLERLTAAVAEEGAEIGALIGQQEPDEALRTAAQAAGDYVSPWSGARYPRLQLLPVDRLIAGETIAYPRVRDKLTVTTTTGGSGLAATSGPRERREQEPVHEPAWQGNLADERPQPPAR
jgi:hypothetical protein